MFTKFDKAFAALLVSGAVPIVTHFTGWMIGEDVQVTLTTVLTGVFVYLIPNKAGSNANPPTSSS